MGRQMEETGRGGIPERKFDGLKQDAERLEKSSPVSTFFMVRQKEEWEREPGANINTDKWHFTSMTT